MIDLAPQSLIRRDGLPRQNLSPAWTSSGSSAVTALSLVEPHALLADGRFDGRIRTWSIEGSLLSETPACGTAITALSSADSLLACGDFSGEVRVWHVHGDGRLEPVLSLKAHTGSIRAMDFAGGMLITAAHDGMVRLWRVPCGALVYEVSPDRHPLAAMSLDHERRRLYCAGAGGKIYDLGVDDPGQPRVVADLGEPVSALALLPSGRGLVVATIGHQLVRIDTVGNVLARSAERAPSWPTSLLVEQRRGIAVVTAADMTTRLWDLEDLRPRGLLPGQGASMAPVVLRPDGGLYRGDDRGDIRLLQIDTDEVTADGHEGSIWSVAIDPGARWLLTGAADNSARVWDIGTGLEIRRLRGHRGWVNSVAFSGDGRTAVSGSSDGAVHIWETGSWRHVQTLRGHTGWVNGVALSTDGHTVLSGSSDGTVRIWDVRTGENTATLTGHTAWVNAVAYSSHEGVALSASADGTVRVWDVRNRSEVAVLKGHAQGVTSVHLSADGQRALSAGYDGVVNCWDLAGQTTRACTFDQPSERIWVVSGGSTGRVAVTAGVDATLRLWDIERRELVVTHGLDTPVTACAMLELPDGNRLVAYGQRDGRFGLIEFPAQPAR